MEAWTAVRCPIYNPEPVTYFRWLPLPILDLGLCQTRFNKHIPHNLLPPIRILRLVSRLVCYFWSRHSIFIVSLSNGYMFTSTVVTVLYVILIRVHHNVHIVQVNFYVHLVEASTSTFWRSPPYTRIIRDISCLSMKQNRLLLKRLNSGSRLKNRQFSRGGFQTFFVGETWSIKFHVIADR